MVKPRKNIIGTKHGRLKIEKQVEDYISPKGIHYARYKCVCECGNIRYYTIANLRDKRIMSCGCINYEVVKDERRLKKRNKYDLSGDYGIGYTRATTRTGTVEEKKGEISLYHTFSSDSNFYKVIEGRITSEQLTTKELKKYIEEKKL